MPVQVAITPMEALMATLLAKLANGVVSGRIAPPFLDASFNSGSENARHLICKCLGRR